MISDDYLLELLHQGYDIDEIASGEYIKEPKRQRIKGYYCYECKKHRVKVQDGFYTCTTCGETEYGHVENFIPEIWMKNKSVHSRKRWFVNKVREFVDSKYIGMISHDFMSVVNVMIKHHLIKGKNVSRYEYYIIRLASRRNINPNKKN